MHNNITKQIVLLEFLECEVLLAEVQIQLRAKVEVDVTTFFEVVSEEDEGCQMKEIITFKV